MKKIFVSLLAFVMAVSAFARDHSTDPDSFYLTVEEMPSSLAILMPMPADTTARFAYDREQYEWGKAFATLRVERWPSPTHTLIPLT